MSKSAQDHAYAILNAIQAAEAAGFYVEIAPNSGMGHHLSVGGSFRLVEPVEEDEPWDMGATP